MLALQRNGSLNECATDVRKTVQQHPLFYPPLLRTFSGAEVSNGAPSEPENPSLLRVARTRECNAQQAAHGTQRDTRGRPLAPLVQCGECSHFTSNPHSPTAGCGTCQLGEPDQGGLPYYPGARRVCRRFGADRVIGNEAEHASEAQR